MDHQLNNNGNSEYSMENDQNEQMYTVNQELVRDLYSKIAEKQEVSMDTVTNHPYLDYVLQLGYIKEECLQIPAQSNMGLGCGNPLAYADLKPGETVLDMGCGAGLDCFLAANKVGPTGRVIGVDVTPMMITRARWNAVIGGYENLEFRLGEVENLPVATATVDVIISNCVINLVVNKTGMFNEMKRVLKPGGRIACCCTVALRTLPDQLKHDLAVYAGCRNGIVSVNEVKKFALEAGFTDIQVAVKPMARAFLEKWTSTTNLDDYLGSGCVQAVVQKEENVKPYEVCYDGS